MPIVHDRRNPTRNRVAPHRAGDSQPTQYVKNRRRRLIRNNLIRNEVIDNNNEIKNNFQINNVNNMDVENVNDVMQENDDNVVQQENIQLTSTVTKRTMLGKNANRLHDCFL